jgi:hypothetical protein
MKYLIFIILFSCAHQANNEVVTNAYNLPVHTFAEKKASLIAMIDNHSEFDQATKTKIETLLINSLETAERLRQKESQLISQIGRKTLVEKGQYDDLLALKKEMKSIYEKKYKNIDLTVSQLKKIIGIKPANDSLLQDIGRMGIFFRN